MVCAPLASTGFLLMASWSDGRRRGDRQPICRCALHCRCLPYHRIFIVGFSCRYLIYPTSRVCHRRSERKTFGPPCTRCDPVHRDARRSDHAVDRTGREGRCARASWRAADRARRFHRAARCAPALGAPHQDNARHRVASRARSRAKQADSPSSESARRCHRALRAAADRIGALGCDW